MAFEYLPSLQCERKVVFPKQGSESPSQWTARMFECDWRGSKCCSMDLHMHESFMCEVIY
jgi:hypothetical protein